jgi:hypothetical protein
MLWDGLGYIAVIDETLNSQLYIQILQEDLQMSIEDRDMKIGICQRASSSLTLQRLIWKLSI